MSALVRQREVFRMLDECAPENTRRLSDHFWRITYKGKTYPSFPKHEQVEVGHIRKVLRHLEIDMECAKKHLSILR